MAISEQDRIHLRRCVALAETALEAGNSPFGTLLVGADGAVLFEDHNRTGDGDATRHPEFAVARWAASHLAPEERVAATTYTSGEHCAMCSAAHGFVGLGRIVYASSSEQLVTWRRELGVRPGPVAPLSIRAVVPACVVDGPDPALEGEIRALHERAARAG